jgi:Holliday junction DNA helicase RuvB
MDMYHTEQDNHNLRPTSLDDYVGQRTLRKQLSISMEASRQRGEALEHILLSGPPGLGKTTLANIIANEMQVKIHTTIGPALSKQMDVMPYLMGLAPREVFFIDEIHRLSKQLEEFLYPVIEDFRVDCLIDNGPRGHKINLPVQQFTFIGATTIVGRLSAPFRNRFGMELELELYGLEDLLTILEKSAHTLRVSYDKEALTEIAKRSRGIPRLANRFLKQVRNYAQINNGGILSENMAKESFILYGIDALGVDKKDRKYLTALNNVFTRPAGINAIAATINEDATTLAEVIEPYLLQLGFVIRGSRGREITKEGENYINAKVMD